jgi:dipeptidyl aminopeptidase/acylaminoacyl peptidase
VILVGLLAGCVGVTDVTPTPEPAPTGTVTFDGRTIDLATHLAGWPYEPALAVPEADLLFYDHEGPSRRLLKAPLASADLAQGSPVSEVDWATRSRWDPRWHAATDSLYFVGDEKNDEVLNLWRLSLADGALTKLTDEPYLYGWSFDPAEERVALVARRGEGPLPSRGGAQPRPYISCVETMKPDGSDRQPVVCDTPKATLTWTSPSWAPDAGGLIVSANVDGQRDRGNIAWVGFGDPELRLLLDPLPRRRTAYALETWLDQGRFLYVSDESGFDQLYAYDVARGVSTQLTKLDREISHASVMEPAPGKKLVVAILHRPDEDRVVTIDPSGGSILDELVVQGSASVLGDDEANAIVLRVASGRAPLELRRLALSPDGQLTESPLLATPPTIAEKLVRCDQEKVTFPTFDTDPATGQPRQLHAFLYTPKEKPAPERAIARIVSFYGGQDDWSTDIHAMCDAGVATLAPAVRGSYGFGSEFSALNDRDLGGNEIVDLVYAARFLESRGYQSGRIGVYGGSHGGYATMRALTFPPGTNGRDETYAWAFGMSHAGFSDIVSFWEACNIPDWVLLEAGDPLTEAEKLHDRSPLSHVDLLAAPLFLSHGANDNRVPVTESRKMAEACAAAGKRCTYVEFPGQGHGIKGLADEVALYQARFRFLETEVLAQGRVTP